MTTAILWEELCLLNVVVVVGRDREGKKEGDKESERGRK